MYKAECRIAYLSKLATNNKELKFKDLYQNLCKPEFLDFAYEQIKDNKGSKTAGVDSVTKESMSDPKVRAERLKKLAEAMWTNEYMPLPVRRIEIPKRNSSKMRPLGIPTLYDRIIQSGLKLILEAIYEQDFTETSHGFRPKRSCQTAINSFVTKKFDWVIEGDIKGCFDNINHGILLNILRKRIADERFINIIAKFLKSGYQIGFGIDGTLPIFMTNNGTPQGGIVSPVLANIYLHEFDKYMQEKLKQPTKKDKKMVSSEYTYYENRIRGLEKDLKIGIYPIKRGYFEQVEGREKKVRKFDEYNTRKEVIEEILRCRKALSKVVRIDKNEWYNNDDLKGLHYVRYADDFIITLTRYDKKTAIELKEEITKWFKDNLKLEVHQEKTKITHSTKNVTFLGYDFNLTANDSGYGYKGNFVNLYVPKDRKDAFLERIDKTIRGGGELHPYDLFNQLNSMINGFGMYYQICNNWSSISRNLNHQIFWKVLHWFGRKYKCTIPNVMDKYYKFIPELNRKGLIAISGDNAKKVRPLAFLNDIKYTPVSYIAKQIQTGKSVETWYISDKENKSMKLAKAFDNGYSEAINVEEMAKGGNA